MRTVGYILSFLAAFAASVAAEASTVWTLQGVEYKVDTLKHVAVGPGTTLTVVDLSGPVKQRVFYTITDLTDPNVEIKTICGKDNLKSNLTVPDMVTYHADTENVYFAGVNSDLFSSGGPIGSTIVGGELYKTAKFSTGWYAIGVTPEKRLVIGQPYTTYRMYSEKSGQMSIKGLNTPRESNDFILYSSRFGATTGTTGSGVEVSAVQVDGGLKSIGTTKMRVSAKGASSGSTIPNNGFVLSANASWYLSGLQSLTVGDIVEVTPTFTVNGDEYQFVEMSGGAPIILSKGVIQNTDGYLDHLKLRRPRTAIGYDTTGTKMVLLVVDGDALNKGVSAGCGSKDLAAMMLAVGCSEALNFDGGGSSTMYTSALGVQNVPSDGGLRKVRNGWFVTTPNRGDKVVASIRFADYVKKVEKDEVYTPVIYGYNEAGLLVDANVKGFTLSCPPELGEIDGTSVKCNATGTYALTATLGSLTATVAVQPASGDSGVDNALVDDDAPVEYFNMQGIKVENPQCGIYIMRRGTKVEKRVVNR